MATPLARYTVERGDTLSKIAARAGVSLQAILSVNPQIRNPNLLQIGQVVNLPTTSGATTQSPLATALDWFNQSQRAAIGLPPQSPLATAQRQFEQQQRAAGTYSPAAPQTVRTGDVIDFELGLGTKPAFSFGYTTQEIGSFRNDLGNAGFQVVGLLDDKDVNVFLGGRLRGRVVIRTAGFSIPDHAAQAVASVATRRGWSVLFARGERTSASADAATINPNVEDEATTKKKRDDTTKIIAASAAALVLIVALSR